MAMDNDDVISVLNGLIETCRDGINGFRTAAGTVTSSEVKAVFATRMRLIEHAAAELESEVRRFGGDPDKHGTVTGSVHRGWINLTSAVTANDDAIIAECGRGEDVAVKRYEEALEKPLPPAIHAMVERQYEGTLQNRDRARTLKGSTEPARATRTRDADRGSPPPA